MDRAKVINHEQAKKTAHTSEAHLARILDIADDAIISVDRDQYIILFNQGAEKIFGYTAQEVIGQPLDLLLPSHFAQVHRQHIHTFDEAAEQARRMGERREVCGCRKDGREFPAEASISKLEMEGQKIFTVILRDITERKKLEEQFRQAQKMEAIGRLAGGIAHDFNNLLTAILGFSQLALLRLDQADPVCLAVEEIEKAGQRATRLTKQLLAFSRKQILQPKELDLNVIVGDIGRMLQRLIGEDIELHTSLSPELRQVKVDPGQIEQVLMNLAVNARDAMSEGGKLTIETGNVELDQAYARSHIGVESGAYVMLAVSDTGCGMDAETQANIFEPFFTTKKQSQGTGLGLPTVYGIVKQSGGHIWVYSEPGQGTTFKIYLPPIQDAIESRKLGKSQTTLPQGSETILLVEDEEAVRKLACTILQMNGYTVLQASNGEKAIEIARQYTEKIHLLLTDVVMPQMGGKALADQISPVRPDIKVLYMSGYTDNAIVHHGVLNQATAFLQKPFTPVVLIEKVQEVLTSP